MHAFGDSRTISGVFPYFLSLCFVSFGPILLYSFAIHSITNESFIAIGNPKNELPQIECLSRIKDNDDDNNDSEHDVDDYLRAEWHEMENDLYLPPWYGLSSHSQTTFTLFTSSHALSYTCFLRLFIVLTYRSSPSFLPSFCMSLMKYM
jgi:hypothetical protein